jgi:hypothetical protein
LLLWILRRKKSESADLDNIVLLVPGCLSRTDRASV